MAELKLTIDSAMKELEGATPLTPAQDIEIEDIISELENIRGDRSGAGSGRDGIDKYIRIAIRHLEALSLVEK